MNQGASDPKSLKAAHLELEALHKRLREAEQTLEAIRTGQVDALVVYTEQGDRVYTLQGADQPYRVFLEQMRQGVATLSREGLVLFANRSMAAMCGVPLERLMGTDLTTYVCENHLEDFCDLLRRVDTIKSVEREVNLSQGDKTVPVLIAITRLADNHGAYIALTATDLSEQKRHEQAMAEHNQAIERLKAEAALRESEERFRSLANAAPIMVWVVSTEGDVEFANSFYYDFFGLRANQVKGQVWQSLLHPEDAGCYIAAFRKSLAEGTTFDALARVKRADGEWRYIHSTGIPRFAIDGEYLGMVGSSPDVTEFKTFQQALEDEVANRTADLEAANTEMQGFTYSVAHDLRAPLRAIVSSSRILQQDLTDILNADQRELLDRQAYNANKLANLIDDLLRLSRVSRQAVNRRTLDVTTLARENLTELGHRWPKCSFDVQEGIAADGDPNLVRLLLQNLLENACKFSPKGGVITVGEIENNGETAIYVRDQGVGFDTAYIHKLFLPFERLHREEEFPGSGVGLASVKRIVERHGGRVWAECDGPNLGSTFFFTLSSK